MFHFLNEFITDYDQDLKPIYSSPEPQPGGYVFKLVLHDICPQIWRHFNVPAGISFRMLHDIIQIVMGWENYHLYRFTFEIYSFLNEPLGTEDRYASELIDAYLQ